MKTPCIVSDKPVIPQIGISRHAICGIMSTVGVRRPETGGILLGPVDTYDITDFFFDAGAQCTGGTYAPDVARLRRKMEEEWLPAGIDFKGFVHSHPGGFDQLNSGDMHYIRRLLEKNPEMSFFASPIVIPEEFRLRTIVVLRDQLDRQYRTSLRII